MASTNRKAAAKTAARPKAKSRAEAVQRRAPSFQGWNTSDADEIERRRWRGLTDIGQVEVLEPEAGHFGTFRARSTSGHAYIVEVRTLDRRENSCDCLDWQINGLGTCKHIEGVLADLQRKGARAYRTARKTGSPRVEVFPAPDGSIAVKLRWPVDFPAAERLSQLVDADGTVVGEPLDAPAFVRDAVADVPETDLRVSRHLDARLEAERRRRRRAEDRAAFLKEVDEGRTSLDVLHHPLLPYQHEGMLHLAFGERALLADEMGLGKTVQAIAACELLRRRRGIRRVLVVSPASLKAEWEDQIQRFTDRSVAIVAGRRAQRLSGYDQDAFFLLANYEQVRQDAADINRVCAPDVIVLDEAQRIKNWQTKTARAVKELKSPCAFVLTGTPLENRIDEIYSIVQYLDPRLLGPLFRFNRDFYVLDEQGRPVDYKNLDALHARLSSVMLRRRKDDVQQQLPGRTVTSYYVTMTAEQKLRYHDYEALAARLVHVAKRRPLTREEFDRLQQWLACMRMICDSPYILDPACRDAPKLAELETVLGDLMAEPGTKVVVFSEWQRMLDLVGELVEAMGLEAAWHTGAIPQDRRRREIRRFKQDPACRLLLSTNSGGLGLNLQVASAVINMDLPWNPAQLEQRIARAWRRDQSRTVSVINLVCENSIEHRIQHIVEAKQDLADGVLDGRGDPKALKMPSGRAAMVERMAAMMEPPAPATPPDPACAFADTVTARLSDHVVAVARHRAADGGDAALVVLDEADDQAAEQVAETARAAGLGEVQTIDRASWATIERLAGTGMLQLAEGLETLYRRADAADGLVHDGAAARRRAQAAPWLDTAERKFRMAAYLADGGFEAEALGPLTEAAAQAVRALALVHDAELDGDAAAAADVLELSERPGVREILPTGVAALLTGDGSADATHLPETRSRIERLLQWVRSAIGRSEAEETRN